jgi:hypothetical protein
VDELTPGPQARKEADPEARLAEVAAFTALAGGEVG